MVKMERLMKRRKEEINFKGSEWVCNFVEKKEKLECK